jgi:putative ABC transport system ATP-binding protein
MVQMQLLDIVKIYCPNKENSVHALKKINLSIEAGEYTAITGTSGAGKSTLLHILGCLDKPTAGRYLFEGNEVDFSNGKTTAAIRNKKIGFVLQEFGLIPHHTVLQNVQVPLLFDNTPYHQIKGKCMDILQRLGIEALANKKVNELSGGQKQRVAIARALVNGPSVLLADEPTGSLDSVTANEIINIFEELNSQKITVVIVTHDLNIASRCHRHILVKDGNISEI